MTLLGADEKGVKSKETWKCFAKTVSGFLFSSDQFICKLSERMTKNKKMKKREKSRKTPNITRVPAFDILRIVILDASKSKRALKTSLKNKKLI